MMTPKTKAELALFGTTLIWGSTFTVVKIGMEDVSPIMLILVRFLVAALIVLAIFRRKIFPLASSAVIKGSILGLFLFLGFVVQNIGLNYTTASKSAFITSMMVVFVPLLQIIVERRSPNIGNVAGIAVVSAGLWLLTSPRGSAFNTGDALTLVCAVLFAVYIVYLDVVSHDMSTQQLTFIQTASTAGFSLIAVLLFENARFTPTTRLIASLGYLTLFATVFTTYIQTRFQKDTTPTKAAIIFTVEPVFAAIIAYLVLGEELGLAGVLGGALIIAGVLLSELADSIPVLNKSFTWQDAHS